MGFLVEKSNFFLKNSGIHEKVHGYGVKMRGYPTISEEIDLKSQDNFNSFIKRLADEIFEEIKKDDKTHF